MPGLEDSSVRERLIKHVLNKDKREFQLASIFLLFRPSPALYKFIYAEFQPLWG